MKTVLYYWDTVFRMPLLIFPHNIVKTINGGTWTVIYPLNRYKMSKWIGLGLTQTTLAAGCNNNVTDVSMSRKMR